MKKREFLLLMVAAVIWPSIISKASIPSFEDFQYTGDGVITVYNTHSKEIETVEYKDKDGLINEGVEELNRLFRCRMTGAKTQMSLKLISLIDNIQDHFGVEEVDVISGYRSPDLNGSLRKRSRRVAKDSLHMKGLAADIRIPGISTRMIRDYARSLKIGGVGYYGKFVHVDVGPVRYW